MSSKTVDISKLTVDDIFRAKEARRERLARLPFEEKIAIVKKLQTVPAALNDERVIFDWFLRIRPDFAGEGIKEWDVVNEWYAKRALVAPPHPFDKRPDIIAITESGKRIGIELKSWVNREQIAEARKQEVIQDHILKAIGRLPPNQTNHIGHVWLDAKEVRFDPQDAVDFRQQLFALIEEVDHNWSQEHGLRQCSHKRRENDFVESPILRKYLQEVHAEPAIRGRSEIDWIDFRPPGGAYSPKEMLGTLKNALLVHRSDERYKDLKGHVALDEVHLLVHYDFKAFAYNTPFDAPNFGFREAAEFASRVLDGEGGHFDCVFLFQFLWGKEEAYRIVPSEFADRPAAIRK